MSSNSSSPQSEPPVDGRVPVPVTTGTPAVPAPPPPGPPNPNAETLIARLRAQVEFYFSPQNLSRDVYLRNLLAQYGGTSVPLLVICQFPKVQKLCASFNVGADPSLVKHSLEGSNVVYVTPDANWISPMQALPPLDPKVNKLRPLPLGPRSMSVSSVQDENYKNGKSSAPSSPSKAAKASGQPNMPGAAANTANANGMHNHNHNLPMQHQQGQPQHNGRPSMVTRSHSSAAGGNPHPQQPAHYHPNNGQPISMTHAPAQGMSVPGPGQAPYPSPYNYQYRMPPPGNYQQPGYVYSHSHLQPHPPGAQMRYPQVYPGYAYVPTSTGPPGYYSHGRPVMVRGRSTGNTSASGNYENGQRRQGPGGMNIGARNRPDGPKQTRKNRNKKGLAQNYDSGTGSGAPNAGAGGMNMNMSRRGSKGELNSQHSKPSDGDLSSGDMNMNMNMNMLRNSHRSQNDMSDSSGGGKMTKRKKNKNKRDGNHDRRKDVSFDANQFPALSPSSPMKMNKDGGPEKVPPVGISGYAAALLQKKAAAPAQVVNTHMIQKEQADEDETDVVAVKVDNLNLKKDDENGSTTGTIAVGALTGTPLTESSVETADEEHSHAKPIEADTVPVPATNLSADIEDKVENDGPTPREAESFEMSPNAEEAANAAAASLPLVKDPPPMAAPPVAWGNKRTFIDVVRKQS